MKESTNNLTIQKPLRKEAIAKAATNIGITEATTADYTKLSRLAFIPRNLDRDFIDEPVIPLHIRQGTGQPRIGRTDWLPGSIR